MDRKAAIELSLNFIIIIVICIVIFGFSIYLFNRFFRHAENIKMTYDERAEREIERLLDDGSRVAIPFDRKTIGNGEFQTFGIGILNVLNIGSTNKFMVGVKFNSAYDIRNDLICSMLVVPPNPGDCGRPDEWLQTTEMEGYYTSPTLRGVSITKNVKNNEQEKFLIGMGVKGAKSGTYIFDLNVTYDNSTTGVPDWVMYDTLHKLYVNVP